MKAALLAAAVCVVAALPVGSAHGLVNAGELETLIVQDEASDVMTEGKFGYDLLQLYVGEAYLPGLGDGLYVHTVLYGGAGARPALDGPMTVRFTFDTDHGPFTRTITTADGTKFGSDFDSLAVQPGSGEVEVQRAFVRYPAGVGPGTVLKSLKAESLVGKELRDVAPGGFFLPGGAPAEVPMGASRQVVDSYTLKGPVGYLTAAVRPTAGGFLLDAHNALKKGDEHIMLGLPEDLHGWTVQHSGGGEVKAGASTTFTLQLTPGDGPLSLDLLSDIGGRIPVLVQQSGSGLQVTAGSEHAMLAGGATHQSPGLGLGMLAALVAVGVWLRRSAA
jgi:hypothetical protein